MLSFAKGTEQFFVSCLEVGRELFHLLLNDTNIFGCSEGLLLKCVCLGSHPISFYHAVKCELISVTNVHPSFIVL